VVAGCAVLLGGVPREALGGVPRGGKVYIVSASRPRYPSLGQGRMLTTSNRAVGVPGGRVRGRSGGAGL
jgi:hypothetical protein